VPSRGVKERGIYPPGCLPEEGKRGIYPPGCFPERLPRASPLPVSLLARYPVSHLLTLLGGLCPEEDLFPLPFPVSLLVSYLPPRTRFTVGLGKREIYQGGRYPPYHASRYTQGVYTPPHSVPARLCSVSMHANHAGQCADVHLLLRHQRGEASPERKAGLFPSEYSLFPRGNLSISANKPATESTFVQGCWESPNPS